MRAGESNEILFADPGVTPGMPLFVELVSEEYVCLDDGYDTIRTDQVTLEGNVITAVLDLPGNTCLGRHHILLNEENQWNRIGILNNLFVFSKPVVTIPPSDRYVCYGSQVHQEIRAYVWEDIQYQWYQWNAPLEGESGSMEGGEVKIPIGLPPVTLSDTGWYHVILSNPWGSDSTGFHLSLLPFQDEVGLPDGPAQLCMGDVSSEYSFPEDPLIDSYQWILKPPEAGEISQNGRFAEVQWNTEYAGIAELYAKTGLGECQGPDSDTLTISLTGPTDPIEICIVGVDETSGHYRIVWNRPDMNTISAFHVYRESNEAGVFLKLGSLAVDEFSVWIDSSSAPDILPHAYRISFTDTCGNESELSKYHKTIHLSANLGTGGENNLSWNHYEGFAFLSYQIFRGTHPDSMVLFQTVPGNINSYTDENPTAPVVHYQIAVSRDGECQPSKKSGIDYSLSKSNIFEINTTGTGKETDVSLKIFPNPATEFVKLTIPDGSRNSGVVRISEISGRLIGAWMMDEGSVTIPTSGWASGIYLLTYEIGGEILHSRFAVH